jgi:hypothetical protein
LALLPLLCCPAKSIISLDLRLDGRSGVARELAAAVGWDRASTLLRVFTGGTWRRYRLPKASHNFEHLWQHEWPRIREVEHERFLMDAQGMFYELSPHSWDGLTWGIQPIARHLRCISDFCLFRGLLVLASNQTTPFGGDNVLAGEAESGIWVGATDDLWSFGKPGGWGGPWAETPVEAGAPSDPYLMTGFEPKGVHLYHDAAGAVTFTLEVDPVGWGAWQPLAAVNVPAGGYVYHAFPPGFAAHWFRTTADTPCRATAYLHY